MYRICVIVLVLSLLVGCRSKSQQNNPTFSSSASTENLTVKERKQLKRLSSLPFVLDGQTLSASHILVSYKGAKDAGEDITRSKAEAAERAKEIYQKLVAGADFDATAKEYSDCPSKSQGGDLGTFRDNNRFSAFNRTAHKLEIGSMSEPVETSRGFHIIRRNKTEQVYTRHILITHRSVKNKPKRVKRSKEAAKNLAMKLREDIKNGNAKFADIARQYSDCSSSQCGGKLKPIGKMGLLPKYEDTAFRLKYWQLSPVIETRYGFHIIQRIPESFALADKRNRENHAQGELENEHKKI